MTNTNFDIGYSKHNINSLFKNLYVVPEYQREYVWEAKEVDTLLSDLIGAFEQNSQKTYFMGMVVVYSDGSNKFELIDGQQRITTFFLLICAIIHIYKENSQSAEAYEQRLHTVEMDDSGRSFNTYSLELQYSESTDVLDSIYKNSFTKAVVDQLPDGSAKRLYSAYDSIRKTLKNNFSSFDELVKFAVYVWNKVQMVQIESRDMSDALKIFETINQRGKGLNSLDLLKNMVFMQVGRDDFKRLNTSWKKMMDNLQIVENKPLRFLRYFITANYDITDDNTGKINGILPEDNIYNWLSKNDQQCKYSSEPFAFMAELSDAVDRYVKYMKPDSIVPGNDYLINVTKVAGATYKSHMVLLLAAKNMNDTTLKYFKQLIELVVYYATINSVKGNETEKLFANWASEIRKIKVTEELKRFASLTVLPKINEWINEKQYKQRFLDLNLNTIQKYRIKYVLARISKYVDEYRGNGRNYADIENYCETNIEIEHIMPQECSDLSMYGINNEEEFNQYLMSIGNLTLLEKTQNAACKNKSYREKEQFYQNSNLYLTKSIHKLTSAGNNNAAVRMDAKLKSWIDWDKNAIEQRSQKLFELAEEVWDIDGTISSWR